MTLPGDPLDRRARQRQQTVDEVLAVARRLLATADEELSLRAVAREMGLTAPALYRYFDSYHALVNALVASLYDDVVRAMTRARDALPTDDVAAQIAASSRAFRAWALENPREFGAIFANPVREVGAHGPDGNPDNPCVQAGRRFGAYFGQLFTRLWLERGFPTPRTSDIDPVLLDQLRRSKEVMPPQLPPEALWVFVRQWSRLYGAVTMEVFGHLEWAMADTDAFFSAVLRESQTELGLGTED